MTINLLKYPLSHDSTQVVGLGQACIDFLGPLPAYPKEDSKVELSSLHRQCGGPASTAIVTLSRLGVQTSFIGSISDDPFGQDIYRNLRDQNVDVSELNMTPGYSSQFAFIAVSQDNGKRTVFWTRGTVPHLRADEVHLERFPAAVILHMDGLMIDACHEAARQAQDRGMTVVLDAGTMRAGLMKLIPLVDVLIASESFADTLVGAKTSRESALYALQRLGTKKVIITLGSQGSLGLDECNVVYQPAFPVPVVDTTGAGDVYHGGFIYGMLKKWDMQSSMRFASAAAALKCQRIGAQDGAPNINAVNRLINDPQLCRLTRGCVNKRALPVPKRRPR
jgi:ribokinase